MYVASNRLAPQTNYLLERPNRLPRLGYRLLRMLDPLSPPNNHLPRLCNRLPVRNKGLVRMYDYLSRALDWWFSGLQERSRGVLSHR